MKPANTARVALVLALAAGLALGFANREALSGDTLSRWLTAAGAWEPLAFMALYAAATVFFLPGSVLTFVAGALFGALPGALYSLTGATLGATLAFLAARYLAADWVARQAGIRWMDSGTLKDSFDRSGELLVIDVRGTEELAGPLGRIPGAHNIPLGELPARLEELEPSKRRPLTLVCRTEKRSITAARLFKQAGFTDVCVLRGGMEQWNREGFAIARESSP